MPSHTLDKGVQRVNTRTTDNWNFHQRHGGGKKKYFILNKRKYNCIIYYIYYIKESFSFYSIHYMCKISNKNYQLVTLTALVVLVLNQFFSNLIYEMSRNSARYEITNY